MARKTFISYKYSEATELRNAIIRELGSDATYYQGETSSSPDMSDYKTDTIRRKLADMIYNTTVMIVVVSPNMKQSSWMEWEIKYALREQSRNGRTSHVDGIVCVIQKDNNPWVSDKYSWAKTSDGKWLTSKFFDVLVKNMGNKKSYADSPLYDKTIYDALSGSYIDIITEDGFLASPAYYINNAFDKSENLGSYNITK